MIPGTKIPLELALRLTLAIALDTAVQLCWKWAALRIPNTSSLWTTVTAVLEQPLFIAVAVLLACQLINWL